MDEQIDIKFITNAPEYSAESKKIENAIQGVETRHSESTADMSDNIKIQKQVLKDLEAQYKETEKAVKAMAPGAAKVTATAQLGGAKAEIDAERNALLELEKQQDSYKKSCTSLRTQIMNLRNSMATMTEGSKEYIGAMMRLGDLQDKMGDIQQQGRIFADDEKYFRTGVELVQGLSGAMSVATGVASLFGASQENLAKIQAKLQAVMAISIGVQQVAQVLNKDSYVSHILLAGAKTKLATATNRLSVALGISNVAAKALMATLTMGLTLAIAAAVWALNKMSTANEEAKKKQEEAREATKQYHQTIADSASKSLTSYNKLRKGWNKLTSDQQKIKFVKDNQKAFEELGIAVKNVSDAENVMVNNSAAVITALMARAKASAAQQLATEKYKKVIELDLDSQFDEKGSAYAKEKLSKEMPGNTGIGDKKYQEKYRELMAQYKSQQVALAQADADAVLQLSQQYAQEAIDALKSAGIREVSGVGSNDSTDHIKEAKERQLAIEQAKIDAMDEGSAKQLAQIDLNHKKEIDKLTEQKASLLKLAQEKGDTKTTTKINTDFKILTGAADDKAIRERAEVTKSMLELIVKDMEKSINDQIDLTNLEYDSNLEYLEKYGDTQQKKFAITQRYNGLILEAKTESQKKILEQERDQALSGADMEGLQKSDLSQLFGNLDNLTLPSMEGLRDKIKAWIDGASKELSPEDFKTVMDAFQKLDLKIADKNPFGELMVAGQEYKTATQEVAQAQANLNDLQAKGVTSGKQYEAAQATLTNAQNNQATAVTKQQQAINSVADKGKQILGAAQDVLGILGDLGIKVPEEIANALDGVGQILDGFGSMDLTKPLSIVTGAVKMLGGLVKSVTSLFGGSNETLEELERRQKEYREKAYLAELEINQLYRDRYDWAQKIGESNLSYIKRQGEELKKQSTDNAKEQDDLMAKLYATDYKSGEHFEKTGLFGWGKGKIVEDRSSLEGKSWEEIEKLAASGALSEEGMKYYEALKKAREEGEDLIAREQQYLESVRELTTGSTYEGVVNGIVEGFKAGKRSAADFADSFEGLLNGAIESALNSLANEKSRAWYEKFAEMGKDGYTEDELAELKADWIKLNEELAEDAKNLETVTGGTIGGGQTNENSLTGQIRGSVATEASVAELGGIFRGQYDKLSSINSQLDLGFKQIAEMAKLQADIAANTGKTASNTDGLGARIDATNTKLDTLIKQTTKDTGDYGG